MLASRPVEFLSWEGDRKLYPNLKAFRVVSVHLVVLVVSLDGYSDRTDIQGTAATGTLLWTRICGCLKLKPLARWLAKKKRFGINLK